MASMTRAKAVVTDLYRGLCRRSGPAAGRLGAQCGARGDPAAAVVRDYIAGMTDTYALAEYARVFQTPKSTL